MTRSGPTGDGRGRKRDQRSTGRPAKEPKQQPKPPARSESKPKRPASTPQAGAVHRRTSAGPSGPKRASAPATPAEVRDAVLAFVRASPGCTDDEIARRLKLTRQRVAAYARALAKLGLIDRHRDPATGTTQNTAIATPEDLARRERDRERRRESAEATALPDAEVREAVADWLSARGFEVEREPGGGGALDLVARRDGDVLACEALGGGKHTAVPRNALPSALGRLVERLGRGHAIYGLAMPDLPSLRSAFAKLPASLRGEMRLHAFFVRRDGAGSHSVAAVDPAGRPTDLL